ncbi:hypothetical protein ZHAS_00013588 [Anopheles sinensis]|uniref:Uncharacterized protein n=1 Tax=Anopheles sinensis TaxID=74873 RepID=A0A084W5V5_ANOSI|nr:hypothetical protein ZHAS_00013588 [Anopheles sinensis]
MNPETTGRKQQQQQTNPKSDDDDGDDGDVDGVGRVDDLLPLPGSARGRWQGCWGLGRTTRITMITTRRPTRTSITTTSMMMSMIIPCRERVEPPQPEC